MVVSQDKTEALVGYYEVLAKPNRPYERLQLKGLEADKLYTVNSDLERYGDDLMEIGLILAGNYIDRASDYWSREHITDYNSKIFYLTEKQ
ncbi:UNVERIFIED_CONTAM: GH36 C-terminal domain-containing protein [Escherichia coli]